MFDPEVVCFWVVGGDLALIGLSHFPLFVDHMYEAQYSALREELHLPSNLLTRL